MNLFIDLDGTLIDVSEKYYHLYKKCLNPGDIALLKYQYWEMKRAKLSDEDIYEATKANIDIKAYYKIKQELLESNELLSLDVLQQYIQPILASLADSYNMFLVTLRKNRENTLYQLGKLDIAHFFKKVLSPSADILLYQGYEQKIKLINEYIESEEDFIIGDSEADILCGKFLNIRTVGLLSGIRNFSVLKELSPEYILVDFSHITQVIQI